ncbi:hypothetical protein [Priestia abyssalis]|uniref:hypothetical protein n=1 Tax=Priestia abyssalis TaxID=1221450 RepID=UPI0009953016|nr:hypothetical protein [Priestia abyssalis]
MRSYLILLMCGLFLIQYFVQSRWLEYVVVVMAFAAFAGSVTKASSMPRWLGMIMMGSGMVLEFQKGGGIEGISRGMSMNLPLLTLVILVPLLSLPLKLDGDFEIIHAVLRRLKHHPRKLFAGITSVVFLLGPILNLGSIRVVDDLLKNLKLPSVILAKSYLVGFSTTMVWSPYYASVGLVLYYLKVPMGEYLPYGIGMAFLFLFAGNVIFWIWSRRHPIGHEEPVTEQSSNIRISHLLRLGLKIAGFMSITLLVEYRTQWSMLVIVSLFSIAFPLLWGIVTKKWKLLLSQLIDFRDKGVPIMNNEILLFTSAGLLGASLQDTSFGSGIKYFLNSMAHQSFLLFAIVVMAIVIIMSFAGIHQLVTVTALVTQMNAVELGTTTHVLAMLLMLSWSVSSVLSPLNPLNLLVSRLSGFSGIETGIRMNGVHLSIVTLIGLLVITMIH